MQASGDRPHEAARGGRQRDSKMGLRPIFTHISFTDVSAPATLKLHQHPHYEVIICNRGDYRCRLNTVEVHLDPDEILVVKPGDWHEDVIAPPLRYEAIGFRLQTHDEQRSVSLFIDEVTPAQQRLVGKHPAFRQIIERMRGEAASGDDFSPQIHDALMLEFFWRMIRALPAEAVVPDYLRKPVDSAFARGLRQLFSQHLHDALSPADMAESLSISQSALTSKCRELLATSPARAFIAFKMDQALLMLHQTEMSVKEISAFLGFGSPFHFSRVFKKRFGKAPSRNR